MQKAQRIFDKVVFMFLGELIEYNTCENIFQNPQNERTKNYVGGYFG